MKFEQLLHIYWAKSFLYAGRTRPFDTPFLYFLEDLEGWGFLSKKLFFKRFEFVPSEELFEKTFLFFKLEKRKAINVYLSRITSINHSLFEILRYSVIRLYLIKSFRGKCQILGKPSRGQRTWSNAWTAYKLNKILKFFINEVKRNNPISTKKESKNLKFIKKKVKKKPLKIKLLDNKKKINFWF